MGTAPECGPGLFFLTLNNHIHDVVSLQCLLIFSYFKRYLKKKEKRFPRMFIYFFHLFFIYS